MISEVKTPVETPVASETIPTTETQVAPTLVKQARKIATKNKAKKLVSDIKTKIAEAPVTTETVPVAEQVAPTETLVQTAAKNKSKKVVTPTTEEVVPPTTEQAPDIELQTKEPKLTVDTYPQ